MNILVLTSVYKDLSLGNRDASTNIVNSFVDSWIKQGHNVLVIHNCHRYPYIVHAVPGFIKKKLASKMGFSIADCAAVSSKEYDDSGATVIRLPIAKYIPHKKPSEKIIKKQLQKIIMILKKYHFIPDVITGHWASPQMEIISQLKKIYNCRTAVVLHGSGYVDDPDFQAERYLPDIDHLGARSESQAEQVKQLLKLEKMPFVCYSGVPDAYLENYSLNLGKFENISTWKFAYVGRLVEYKKVDATIKALSALDVDWEFNIIGDGASRSSLEALCKELNVESRVNFLGRVSRDVVMEYLNDTHCFIMISINEIFGLVYLEAMAASCITIASENGGVDGIIKNGENGYLCLEGDSDDLYDKLTEIMKSDEESLKRISENGYQTAHLYSNSNIAKKYLDIIS